MILLLITGLFVLMNPVTKYDKDIVEISSLYGNSPSLVKAIILVESSGKANAVLETTKEKSYGLGQINIKAFPQYTKAFLLKPRNNITAMNIILKDIRINVSSNPLDMASIYNAGHLKKSVTGRYIINQSYVNKVSKYL